MKSEPAIFHTLAAAAVTIVAGILIRHGVINGLSQETKDTITLAIAGVATAVAGWLVRRKVTPVVKEG